MYVDLHTQHSARATNLHITDWSDTQF